MENPIMSKRVFYEYLQASSTIRCLMTLLLILKSFLPGNTIGAVCGPESLMKEANAPFPGVFVFAVYLWLPVKDTESSSMNRSPLYESLLVASWRREV